MATQYYGLTGRKIKPDYVGIVNARVSNLPLQKRLADEKKYRAELLGLEERQINESNALARDRLAAQKKAGTRASIIGLGQLGASAYLGKKRDKELKDIIEGLGSSGKSTPGSVSPEPVAPVVSEGFGDVTKLGSQGGYIGSGSTGAKGTFDVPDISPSGSFADKLITGASNWGPIVTGGLTGGTVGAELGEKFIPGGSKTAKRVIGGAATGGAVGYLASGDLYTAGLSAVFGGAIGGLF